MACAEVDLARWLGGDYRIETGEAGIGAAQPTSDDTDDPDPMGSSG
jgi:endogenous inhibitor of DNA gyrase (YacG/DUF329 family)